MQKINRNNNSLTYISLFSGAGVGCYGFKLADFECVATNELLEKRLEIQKYNNKCKYDSGYISGDITNKNVRNKIFEEINRWKKKENIKDIDVLIATPPCQGMSVANHKKKDELARNSLVIESIKLITEINPRFFIFENVRAFLKTPCIDKDNKIKPINDAIFDNLSPNYNIITKVINFKDIGVPSSRTRTLVLAVRKDITDISPFDLLPDYEHLKNIKDTIGDLTPLTVMGEIDKSDIYHNFRIYDQKMRSWISNLKEGESAFNNTDPKKRPHKLINNKIVYNSNKNGDKYTRNCWNSIGPCIHTRNDILASQSTIHPKDDRVFSIRELMRLMSIPDSFKWSEIPITELNNLSLSEKKKFLKNNELNIRQSIGEAVPTLVFTKIATKIKDKLENTNLPITKLNKLIIDNKLNIQKNAIKFVRENNDQLDFVTLTKICEYANSKRINVAAYYTNQSVCFSIIKDLPNFSEIEKLQILEPAVGCGNFLPQLIKKYESHPNVNIDLIDIDLEALNILKELLKKTNVPKNIKLNFVHSDFLLYDFNKHNKTHYNLIIGNPPFIKVKNKDLLQQYKQEVYNTDTNNTFSFFIEKAIRLGDYIAFISPKSLLSSPEYDKTREILEKNNILKIMDYGESAFNVKIETISFIASTNTPINPQIKIESQITRNIEYKPRNYILASEFPYWLIYRNSFFDNVIKKMQLGIFTSFRDRKITKAHTRNCGQIRVLKSRNLSVHGEIINVPDYDAYIDSLDNIAVAKFLNKKNIVIIPNLSYKPRATFLPKGCICDGSLALLSTKNNLPITQSQLDYFKNKEFTEYYRIARNYGTRSLNIDRNSVFFWGIINEL